MGARGPPCAGANAAGRAEVGDWAASWSAVRVRLCRLEVWFGAALSKSGISSSISCLMVITVEAKESSTKFTDLDFLEGSHCYC